MSQQFCEFCSCGNKPREPSGQSSMQNRKRHQKVGAFDSRYCCPLTHMDSNDQAVCLFVSDLTSAATAPSPFPSLQNWGTTWSLTPATGLSSAATVAVPLPEPPPSTTTSGPTLEKSPSSKWWLTFHPIFLLAFSGSRQTRRIGAARLSQRVEKAVWKVNVQAVKGPTCLVAVVCKMRSENLYIDPHSSCSTLDMRPTFWDCFLISKIRK